MRPSVTAMLLVYNEADRYLTRVLDSLTSWVSHFVILDDGSTDQTPYLCKQYPQTIALVHNERRLFPIDESKAREQLWKMTVATEPEWILAIDADELFEPCMAEQAPALLDQSLFDAIDFRLFDCWDDEGQYRCDGVWDPWNRTVRMLVRYRADRPYTWPSVPAHGGAWPLEVRQGLASCTSDVRIQHLGWVRPEDRLRKYRFKAQRDLAFTGAISEATQSILASPEQISLRPFHPRQSLW